MEPMLINTALKSLFLKKLDKVNNKARKLGMSIVDVTFGATAEYPASTDTIGSYVVLNENNKRVRVALYTEVFITGEAPVINGWALAGVVDLRGEKPVVRKAPYATEQDLSDYFETNSRCDHCNTHRARNDVLLIENVETGELMQLGRNCANDFFGTKDAQQRIAVCDWIDAYGAGDGDNLPRGEVTVPVVRIYEVAAAVVRNFGWVHQRDCREDNTLVPTRGRTLQNLFPWPGMKAEDRVKVTKDDEAEALVVMEWLQRKFLDVPKEDASEFVLSVQASVEGQDSVPYVRERNLNYLIWGIAGYKRDLQKEADERRREAERAEQMKASEFVGTIGERRDFTLTLKFKRAFASEFGNRYLQKFEDSDGNVVIWWGTNDTAARTVVGFTYTFKATVKGHETYEEIKQTCLTRAKLLEGELKDLDE